MIIVLLALAGGLGAVTRFMVDAAIVRRLRVASLPWGTLAINISGSFLLGLLTALGTRHAGFPPELRAITGTGFCGGYTTFSTALVETARLHRAGEHTRALTYTLIMLGGSVLAAALGSVLGTVL